MKILKGESGGTSAGWHFLADAMRCLKEYQFRHIRNVYEPHNRTPEALAVGSLVHAGRACWLHRRCRADSKTWAAVTAAVQEEAESQKLPVTSDAERRALVILEQFIRHWACKPLPKPVATEYLLGPAPLQKGDPRSMWRTGKPDDLSEYPEGGKGLWLGDCKTTSGSPEDVIREYELHGQFLQMILLYKNSPNGEAHFGPVNGIMLDIIKKGYGDKEKCKFVRYPFQVTDYSIEWFLRSARPMLKVIDGLGWNDEVPRNITQCTRMAGRMRIDCEYKALCRFGKSASAKYVVGEKAESLMNWKASEDKIIPPWA